MDAVIQELAKLGIPGLFIAYLIWCCFEKDKKYDRREDEFSALHEKRVTESKENARAMADTAQALKHLSDGVNVAVETMAAASRAMVQATTEFREASDAPERRRR